MNTAARTVVSWSIVMLLGILGCRTPRPAAPTASGSTPDPAKVSVEPEATATVPSTPTVDPPLQVAITFDDLPAHGPLPASETLLSVHTQLLDVLDAHGVPRVYGFVNGGKLDRAPEGRRVLELWRDRGHPLGNHTLRHSDINKIGAEAFIEEIEQNDALLGELLGNYDEARHQRRAFRFPYLRQGADRQTLDRVRDYLLDHDYRLAEVTIDFGDWAYNPPYVRCVAKGDHEAIKDLRWSFVATGLMYLRWSDTTAKSIFGRRIPHVLVMHSGSFDAIVLDELLSRYEDRAGVEWISLDEALADPAYQQDVRVPAKYGGSLLEQMIEAEGHEHPPFPVQPVGLLSHICK